MGTNRCASKFGDRAVNAAEKRFEGVEKRTEGWYLVFGSGGKYASNVDDDVEDVVSEEAVSE